jgi:imidazolonepropionase-like amidohydrolase
MLRLLFPTTLVLIGLGTVSLLGGPSSDSSPIAFQGARIHTVAGDPIDGGVLVIDKGKILAVGGPETPIPAGARVIDARGREIIPGLVDCHSHIGIYGRPAVPAHSDGNEGSGPVQSGLRAEDAVWPDDPGIRMAVAGGVTTANIMPGSGNVIGGQTIYVKLRGRTIAEMKINGPVLGGLKMANGENPKNFNFTAKKMPPATRMKLAALQREQFVKARDYRRRKEAFRKAQAAGKEATPPDTEPDMEALVEVLEHKRTVHFHCHRADDLMTAVRLAREFDFEIVLQHATEGYRVAEELARLKIPVSLTLVDSPGGKAETMGLLEENAAILEKAGVLVTINTDDFITESRFLLRTGAIAVRGGMPEASALRALTLSGARLLHLEDRLGSLEKGKDADFAVLSGPPFSIYTQVLQTWIDGVLRFDRSNDADWPFQAGGFALLDRDRLPPRPKAVTPLPSVKAPARPEKATAPDSERPARLAVLAGRVHTVSGDILTDAVVLLEKGVIQAVGPRDKVEIPAGTPVLTAAVVTPGLIDAHSVVGLTGAVNIPADQDQDEKSDPIQPELRVLDGFNPEEPLLEFLRREGVTVIHAVPGRVNVIAGQTGIFRTAGRTAESMAVRFPAGILVNLGEIPKAAYPGKAPTTRMATAALVRSALTQARNYARKGAVKDEERRPARNARHEALALALEKKVPVLFAAHRADDLLTGLRLAKEFDLRARMELATEAYQIRNELLAAGVPVVVHPTMQRAASTMETYHAHLGNAAALANSGIPLAIGTGFEGYVPKTRVLRHEAAVAMVSGLGHDRALRAITLDAARILGIDKEYGSLEVGKAADLVLYDGDCFENRTHVTWTILGGRIVYDRGDYLKMPFARRALPLAGGAGVGCCLGAW